jgi:hypothetical protein
MHYAVLKFGVAFCCLRCLEFVANYYNFTKIGPLQYIFTSTKPPTESRSPWPTFLHASLTSFTFGLMFSSKFFARYYFVNSDVTRVQNLVQCLTPIESWSPKSTFHALFTFLWFKCIYSSWIYACFITSIWNVFFYIGNLIVVHIKDLLGSVLH